MNAKRLLLVDDQPELLRLMSAYLPRAGYAVTCCSTGAEALETLASGEPMAAAIVDMGLPDVDGRELLERMADSYPALRILISSGAYLDDEPFQDEYHGRVSYLQKPYLPKALLAALDQLLSPAR